MSFIVEFNIEVSSSSSSSVMVLNIVVFTDTLENKKGVYNI